MAQNLTELSFLFTADTTGFSGVVTQAASAVEKAIQGVTQAQRELGASRDMDGLLKVTENGVDRVVEGLQNWQIAMGYSRDSMGKLRNAQGQLVESLSATEQKMGFYKDALDNVYNAEGRLVREGSRAIALRAKSLKDADAAIKAMEAEAKAQEEANKALERSIALQAYMIMTLTTTAPTGSRNAYWSPSKRHSPMAATAGIDASISL